MDQLNDRSSERGARRKVPAASACVSSVSVVVGQAARILCRGSDILYAGSIAAVILISCRHRWGRFRPFRLIFWLTMFSDGCRHASSVSCTGAFAAVRSCGRSSLRFATISVQGFGAQMGFQAIAGTISTPDNPAMFHSPFYDVRGNRYSQLRQGMLQRHALGCFAMSSTTANTTPRIFFRPDRHVLSSETRWVGYGLSRFSFRAPLATRSGGFHAMIGWLAVLRPLRGLSHGARHLAGQLVLP